MPTTEGASYLVPGSGDVGDAKQPQVTTSEMPVRLPVSLKRPKTHASQHPALATTASDAGMLPGTVVGSSTASPSYALDPAQAAMLETDLGLFDQGARLQATKAAVRIQAHFRAILGKNKWLEERNHRCATRIQAAVRGRKARRMAGFTAAYKGLSRQRGSSKISILHGRTASAFDNFTTGSGQEAHFIAPDQPAVLTLTEGTQGHVEFQGGLKRRLLDPTLSNFRSAQQAKFVCMRAQEEIATPFGQLSPAQKTERVQLLMGLTQYIKHAWNVNLPSVIFGARVTSATSSLVHHKRLICLPAYWLRLHLPVWCATDVTGDEMEFKLRPVFLEVFKNSFLSATRNTNSWVVTGGLDTGIMKLVGDTLATVQSHETTLAIASLGTVHGRSRLLNKRSKLHSNSTVMVNQITYDFVMHLGRCKKPLTELLHEKFSMHGAVIGITILRLHARTPSHPRGKVEQVTVGNTQDVKTSSTCKYVGFVSFQDTTGQAAQAAAVPQWISHEGKSATVHTTIFEPGQTEGTLKADATPYTALEKKGFNIHAQKVLASCGSTACPYEYNGERDVYREGPRGVRLNPNYSHYLLIDDGTESDFGREISLRADLLDFISYRRDIEKADWEQLTKNVEERSGSRVVPVISFVFGGGTNSVETVIESIANNNPVIVAAGSGRFADLLATWTALHRQIAEVTKNAEPAPWHLLEQQNALARTWVVSNDVAKHSEPKGNDLDQEMSARLHTQVERTRTVMDLIAQYSQLYFFQIGDKTVTKIDAADELLPVVLEAIFKSASINNSVKLTLAVRYGSVSYIDDIMKRQGSRQLLSNNEEMTVDARLPVFAAFHNQAHVFTRLESWGFEGLQIDNLILLELHQMAELHVLSKCKQMNAPRSWIRGSRLARRHETSAEEEKWLGLSTHDQVAVLRQEWRDLPLDRQKQIYSDEIQRVGWDKLPWLSGWTYRAVHFLGRVSEHVSDFLGRDFRLTKVQRASNGEIKVVFIGAAGVERQGTVISSDEAERLVGQHIAKGADESWRDAFILDSCQWVKLYDPSVSMVIPSLEPNVLLQQRVFDGVVSSLMIDEPGRWTPKKQHGMQRMMSKRLVKNAFKSFHPWLSIENVRLGEPWWRPAAPVTAEHDSGAPHVALHSATLDPLHRLFWAIMTNRDSLAEVLWKKLPANGSFAGAFLCSFAIRHAKNSNPGVSAAQAAAWNEKTIRFLDEVEKHLDPECIRAIFDEYLYFGLVEEEFALQHPHVTTRYSTLDRNDRIANAKRRFALMLMGCDVADPKTRVDLAIIASNKQFLGHDSTQLFMDTLWRSPCFPGSTELYSENLLASAPLRSLTSPRMKFWSSLVGYIAFLCLYATVYLDTPDGGQQLGLSVPTQMSSPSRAEQIFWAWCGSLLINEVNQMRSNFNSVSEYLSASGNWYDATIQTFLTVAFLFRFASYHMFHDPDIPALGVDRCIATYPSCELYLVTLGLLSITFICCGFRVLKSLNIFREVGILLIIVQDIVRKDVGPFTVVLFIVLQCFTVGGYFFFLASDQSVEWYRVGSNYVNAWIDPGNIEYLAESLGERHLRSRFENYYTLSAHAQWVYSFTFFIFSSIILTNLLIAMMSDRFAKVTAAASAEWRVVFSGQVREYYDATILPLPLNVLEIVLNTWKRPKMLLGLYRFAGLDNADSPVWGRHYIWPKPTSRFDLHFTVHHEEMAGEQHSEEVVRLRQIQTAMAKKDAKEAELVQVRLTQSTHDSGGSGYNRVIIRDRGAVYTESLLLAKELGVTELWKPGAAHSYIGPGIPIQILQIPPGPLETEDGLMNALNKFGSVLAVSVHRRVGTAPDGRSLRTWALINFVTEQGAKGALEQARKELAIPGLIVRSVDIAKELGSLGDDGSFVRFHVTKAEANSTRGEVLCETPGMSLHVGERCAAVRMIDKRVLLVRVSGLVPDNHWQQAVPRRMPKTVSHAAADPDESVQQDAIKRRLPSKLAKTVGKAPVGAYSSIEVEDRTVIDGNEMSTAHDTSTGHTVETANDKSNVASGGSWREHSITPSMLQHPKLKATVYAALFMRRNLDNGVNSDEENDDGVDSDEENERSLEALLQESNDGNSGNGGGGRGGSTDGHDSDEYVEYGIFS